MSKPSFLNALRGAATGATPGLTGAQVTQRLQAALTALAAVEAEYPTAALDAEMGTSGGQERLADVIANIAKAKARVDVLRAAEGQLRGVEAELKAKAARDIHLTRAKAARAHLAEVAKRGQAVSTLTAQLAEEWFALTKAVSAVRAASPIPLQSPGLSHGGMAQAFKLEIDRANLHADPYSRMPGGVLSDHPGNVINPHNVATSFGDRVAGEVDALLKRLSEKPA